MLKLRRIFAWEGRGKEEELGRAPRGLLGELVMFYFFFFYFLIGVQVI